MYSDLALPVPSLGIQTLQRRGKTSPSVRRCILLILTDRLDIGCTDLMSGSNLNMSMVTPVVEHLDGTDSTLTPFHWKCPDVAPNSAIYFYQVWYTTLASLWACH